MKVEKTGRKWIVIGAENTWAENRAFPTKWRAETAIKVIEDGGRVSDYQKEARSRVAPSATVGGNWTRFRRLPKLIEVDFHHSDSGLRKIPYDEAMHEVYRETGASLVKAHELGLSWVMFTHGSSTSRPGQATARSEVRRAIKDKDSTPYVLKSKCIQHESVYVAAIRPNPEATPLPDIPDCPECKSTRVEQETTTVGRFKCSQCHHCFDWFSWSELSDENQGQET